VEINLEGRRFFDVFKFLSYIMQRTSLRGKCIIDYLIEYFDEMYDKNKMCIPIRSVYFMFILR